MGFAISQNESATGIHVFQLNGEYGNTIPREKAGSQHLSQETVSPKRLITSKWTF